MFKNLKNKELLLSFIAGIFLVSILGFSVKAETFGFLSPAKAAFDAVKNAPDAFKAAGEKINSFFNNFFPPKTPEIDSPLELDNTEEPLPVSINIQTHEDQIVRVVEKSAPSVVSIIVSKDLPVFEQYYVNH